jgi:hypothetical protein
MAMGRHDPNGGGFLRGRERRPRNPLAVTSAQLARAMRWPIGTPVTVTKDHGDQVDTATRSAPWKLGDTWVILVEGISGGYALARVAERSEVR